MQGASPWKKFDEAVCERRQTNVRRMKRISSKGHPLEQSDQEGDIHWLQVVQAAGKILLAMNGKAYCP